MKFTTLIKNKISTDRNPVMTLISDKIRVKEYVDERVGEIGLFDHRIFAGYDLREAIEHITPPCVMKINNSWHRMQFFYDDNYDKTQVYNKFVPWFLGKPHSSWEWAYKNIVPGIVIEKIINNNLFKGHNLFKLFVFGGRVEYIWAQRYNVDTGRIGLIGATMYDREWHNQNVGWTTTDQPEFGRPICLSQIIEISEALTRETPKKISEYARIDIYCNNEKLLFSEMTHYHGGGTQGFNPPEFDEVLGAAWEAVK